jgi:hypothetical protein
MTIMARRAAAKETVAEPLRVRLPAYPRQAEALSHASRRRRTRL